MSAIEPRELSVRMPFELDKFITDANNIYHLVGPADQADICVSAAAARGVLIDKKSLFQNERLIGDFDGNEGHLNIVKSIEIQSRSVDAGDKGRISMPYDAISNRIDIVIVECKRNDAPSL